MNNTVSHKTFTLKELYFVVFLNIVVFVFYAFDKRIPGLEAHQILFYLNFALAALFINYVLLPKFLYKNKYLMFTVSTFLVVITVIIIEEFVLERIFYPDTRGRRFSNIFYNLLNTLPTLTILVGFKFAWDAIIQQKEVQKLKNSVRESELQFLKSQINPHFLFNNINNLYAHALEQSPKTPEIILELSTVLRYMLYECKAKYVSLEKEIEQLKNYVNLSKFQIEGRGDLQFNCSEIPSNYKIAPLILSVFIENAFKHSASSLTDSININIDLKVTPEGLLTFKCSNTYTTATNVERLPHGIGLKNVQKRLQLLYPNNHDLHVTAKKGVYTVNLTMNLNNQQ